MHASDLRSEIRWLASGFLLTFASGFGQTYFIAVFAGHLKADLAMTDGEFGSLFMIGTLAGAALLMWAGKLADRLSIRWLGSGVLGGLALASLAMAGVASAAMLAFVLMGLRFFGQGMLTHVAMTAMGRWFNRRRGRAASIAALGIPISGAVLPLTAVALIGLVGWRLTWVAATAALLLLSVPALIVLLTRERVPAAAPTASDPGGRHPIRRQWTRSEVLRSPLFYALAPGVLAMPFIGTAIFFHQVAIVEAKGWQLSWFAGNLPILAGVTVLSALAVGRVVDRIGARRLLPALLVPLGVAILVLVHGTSPNVLPVFMALFALTIGGDSTAQGALWAELYGTEHLGAIRALAAAGAVFATALSPALTGLLMDAGVALQTQLLAMAAYCFVASLWMGLLVPRLNQMATA